MLKQGKALFALVQRFLPLQGGHRSDHCPLAQGRQEPRKRIVGDVDPEVPQKECYKHPLCAALFNLFILYFGNVWTVFLQQKQQNKQNTHTPVRYKHDHLIRLSAPSPQGEDFGCIDTGGFSPFRVGSDPSARGAGRSEVSCDRNRKLKE